MAGSLFHSHKFRAESFVGADGEPHHEIVAVDGRTEGVSYSSWSELKQFGLHHGIPVEVWPEFLDCEFAIDIPLDAIRPASERFRAAVADFDRSIECPHWLAKIFDYLDARELVFFC